MVNKVSYEILDYRLKSNNRFDIRRELVELFLDEHPGEGRGDLSSKYEYIVEKYGDYSIFIKRPATLNYGFDFVVNVDGAIFRTNRRHMNPSHNDIFSVLEHTKTLFPNDYELVAEQIYNIYNVHEYDFRELEHIYFIDGDGIETPIALILLAIKWLFIEQDITYWNWSGRRMLMDGLSERGLV